MATIGNLFVKVGASTSGFMKAMAGARRAVGDFASSVASKTVGLLAFGAALTGVAGVLSGSFIKAHISAMDAVAKSALALGTTTEAYGGLQYAMKLAGVEAEAFNTAMMKMMRTIGDASLGVQTSIDALAAIGLTIADLQGLSADKVFLKIIDALNRIPDPARRAAMAQDIFGKGAGSLGAIIAEGTGGLQAYIVEWQRLHGVTDGSLAVLQLADDSFTRLEEIGNGLASVIAIELTPYIGALADYLVGAATEANGFGGMISGVFSYIIPVIQFAADVVNSLGVAFEFVRGVVLAFAAAGAKSSELFLTIIDNATLGLTGLGELAQTMHDMAGSLGEQSLEAFKEAGKKFDALADSDIAKSLEQAVERQRETMRKLAEEGGKAVPLLEKSLSPLEEMEKVTEKIDENLQSVTDNAEAASTAIEVPLKALEPGAMLSTVDTALGSFVFSQGGGGDGMPQIPSADMSIFAGMGAANPDELWMGLGGASAHADAAMRASADKDEEGMKEANEHLERIEANTRGLTEAFS